MTNLRVMDAAIPPQRARVDDHRCHSSDPQSTDPRTRLTTFVGVQTLYKTLLQHQIFRDENYGTVRKGTLPRRPEVNWS